MVRIITVTLKSDAGYDYDTRLVKLSKINPEYSVLENNLKAQQKILDMFEKCLNAYNDGNIKHALKPYTEKQIANWSNSKKIGAYKQDNYLDLRIQTMFANNKKGNNAVIADVQAPALTPEANHGNVSFGNNVTQSETSVNINDMQNNSKFSLRESVEHKKEDLPQVNHQLHTSLATINGKSTSTSISKLNENVKFSLREPVEQKKDLIAVHNLSEEKMLKSLSLGGLPMPSIAIAKAKYGHTEFGKISLVFPASTIDPERKYNQVYSGDAYMDCSK